MGPPSPAQIRTSHVHEAVCISDSERFKASFFRIVHAESSRLLFGDSSGHLGFRDMCRYERAPQIISPCTAQCWEREMITENYVDGNGEPGAG